MIGIFEGMESLVKMFRLNQDYPEVSFSTFIKFSKKCSSILYK